MTLQEQLEQINMAIATIESSGQEYRTSTGKTLRRADLNTLYTERRRLQQEQAMLENSGGIYAVSYRRG